MAVPGSPVTPRSGECWLCRRQAQCDHQGWPATMALRFRDDGPVWECFDRKACLRRTMTRLVAGQS